MAHAFAIPVKELTIMYQNPDVTDHPFQWKRQCLQGTLDSVFSSFGCPGASSVDCASKRGFVARSFPSTSQVQTIGKGKGSKMNKTPKNMSHGQPTAKLKACDFNHTDGRVSSYALSNATKTLQHQGRRLSMPQLLACFVDLQKAATTVDETHSGSLIFSIEGPWSC